MTREIMRTIDIMGEQVIANSKQEAIENSFHSSEEYFDDVGFVLDTTNKEHTAFLDINYKAYIVKSINGQDN